MAERAVRVFGYTDIHWSDRDEQAVAVADAALQAFQPDITVLGGDLHNCDTFSRHTPHTIDNDTGYDLVQSELAPVSVWLNTVQKHTKRLTVFLEGNHDQWVERWIVRTGNKGLQSLCPKRYHAHRERFRIVPLSPMRGDRRSCYRLRSDLITVHGWCAPKYAAARHLELAGDTSVIFHHTHRTDLRSKELFRGKRIQAFSAGCLCKKTPKYAHQGSPTEWTHGFWVAYIGTTSFTAYPVNIDKNTAVLPDGTEIRI